MTGTQDALRVLDLFSGIGGFSLGLERTGGFRTVAFCEIDPFCRRVLAKHWPDVPIHGDVRTLTSGHLKWVHRVSKIDVICGGFPCQDISFSGEGKGIEGPKSGLWREFARLIGEIRPSYVIVENVAALLRRGMDAVLGSLAALGYDAEWRCLTASQFGLPQARDRVWIVAYPGSSGLAPGGERHATRAEAIRWPDDDRLGEAQDRTQACAARAWRMDDGIPGWMDRSRGLGNAVVPQIPEAIGRAILDVVRPSMGSESTSNSGAT